MIGGKFLIGLLFKANVLLFDGKKGNFIIVELLVEILNLFQEFGDKFRVHNVMFFGG